MTGEAALRWSVRLAVGLWLLKAALELRRRGRPPSAAEAAAHAAGCVAYLVHVWTAFASRHGWSHAAAAAHTAAETRRVVGFDAAWGVWVNYAFTLLWAADAARVAAAWLRGRVTGRAADRVVFWAFAFIVFQSTVVFGGDGWRWAGVGLLAAWAVLRCRIWRTGRK